LRWIASTVTQSRPALMTTRVREPVLSETARDSVSNPARARPKTTIIL